MVAVVPIEVETISPIASHWVSYTDVKTEGPPAQKKATASRLPPSSFVSAMTWSRYAASAASISNATMLVILIIGLIAGPAVSL
jgi:hypothetical protein